MSRPPSSTAPPEITPPPYPGLPPWLELALRTGDPESAIGQLHPLRASCLSSLGHEPDDLQHEHGSTYEQQ